MQPLGGVSKFACIRMYYLCVIGWFAATSGGPEISRSKFACIRMYYLCVIGWFAATRWCPKRSLGLSLPVFLCIVFVSLVGLQPLGGFQRDLNVQVCLYSYV